VPEAVPRPVKVAAVVVALEGLLSVGLGIAEAIDIERDRLTNGLTTAIFLAAYGAGLLVVARGLSRVKTWSRGPAVFAQLIQLGLAWNFWGNETTWIALLLGATALAVLVAIFQRSSIDALVDHERFTP
jgi:hypothetical protein